MSDSHRIQSLTVNCHVSEESTEITNPNWQDVKAAILRFKTGDVWRVDLSDEGGRLDLSIFGNSNMFHVDLIEDEIKHWYFWDGEPPSQQLVEMAGHFFYSHQICRNISTVLRMAEVFFKSGKPSPDIQWTFEQVEV